MTYRQLLACSFSEPQFQKHRPQPTFLKGVIRYGIWGVLRQIIRLIHLVETGGYENIYCCRWAMACF